MMMRPASASCPPIVLDWIAWYPEGDLPEDVRSAIERHAAECAACRLEIADLAGEGALEAAPGSEHVFDRTLQKIAARPRRVVPSPRRRIWAVRPVFAVAASLAVALLSATVGMVATEQFRRAAASEAAGATYQPATIASPARDAGAQLEVVFRADASFAEITRAIRALGANVESGPSASGVVHLRLAQGEDPKLAARRLESGDLHVAEFAQPAP